MVEVRVDPVSHRVLQYREVDQQVRLIELFAFEFDLHPSVVTVRMGTFAIIVQEPVAVCELDFGANPIVPAAHAISLPPSTERSAPVMKSDLSMRKAVAFAMSSGLPQ